MIENESVDLDAADIEDVVRPAEDLEGSVLSPGCDIARIKPAIAKCFSGCSRIADIARGQIGIANAQNSGRAVCGRLSIDIKDLNLRIKCLAPGQESLVRTKGAHIGEHLVGFACTEHI